MATPAAATGLHPPAEGAVQRSKADWSRIVRRAEWMIAIGLTLLAVSWHVVNAGHAGAMWRDEQNLLGVEEARTWSEWWRVLPYDSSGPVCSLGLHLLRVVGIPLSDPVLRGLGLFVGLAVLAALWIVVARLGRTPPLLALGFFAVNAIFVRYGDSVRAYGVGMLTGLGVIGGFYAAVETPSARRWLLSAGISILAVHTLYGNAVIVGACCVAGFVALPGRNSRVACLASGAVCAATLAIEVPIFAIARDFIRSYTSPTTGGRFLEVFAEIVTDSGEHGWAAVVLLLITVLAAIIAAFSRGRKVAGFGSEPGDRMVLFTLVAILIIPLAYVTYLETSGFLTFPWHLLQPVLIVAALCDSLRGQLLEAIAPGSRGAESSRAANALRLVTLATCTAAGALTVFATETSERLYRPATNVRLIADRLTRETTADDLVIVYPWVRGVSFSRYYAGKAPWVTVPPMSDVRTHRADLILATLEDVEASADPGVPIRSVAETIQRAVDTVRAGHRVWWMGEEVAASPMPRLPRPSRTSPPWQGLDYYSAWASAMRQALLEAGAGWEYLPIAGADAADRLELGRLYVASVRGDRQSIPAGGKR